jgi:succinate-semialdehyde dehydrogenase/glutarate-semialdehyde dehydrogenase
MLKDPSLLETRAYIGGEWVDGDDGTFDVVNPARGDVIAKVANLSRAQVAGAIAQAEKAQKEWASWTGKERAGVMRKWFDLMMDNQDDLGTILTAEQGKPLGEAKGEIAYGASFIEFFGEEAKRVYGETIPGHQRDKRITVIKQPIGVTAAITPWNFPSSMITRKAGAALAAGCTMVVKPASATPYSALALAELAERAGIPAGVFNVITGSAGAISTALTDSPILRKLSFTGSTEVGSKLMAQCAKHIQKVSLELGGNAPFIVFDDANLDKAVEGAMASKFRNTGQTCVCVNRFLVQDSIHDAFVEKLKTAIEAMKVGDGLEDGVSQAALINRDAADKVMEHLEDALGKGAKVVTGGQRHQRGGNFVQPTLITGVTTDAQLCQEETFGPLAAVIPFRTEEEAIRIANDTPYGLAAYFYSDNIHRCWRVAEALESGMVGVNEGLISNAAAPFGGVKESGLGREGSHQGMDEYLEDKYLCMGS